MGVPRQRVVDGFDYDTQTALRLTRKEWREKIQACLKKGGRREVVEGETFIYGPSGFLLYEVYENLKV